MYHVPLALQVMEVKIGIGRRGVREEWILPGLLYADDLVFCGESEEDLRAMVECFVKVCKRIGLKVNASKSKVMVLNGEERLQGGYGCIYCLVESPCGMATPRVGEPAG